MQVPVYGDMISVKNLKKCLEGLDDDMYLLPTKYGDLCICKLEKFTGQFEGRLKDIKIENVISFFYEEVISNERYKQMNERENFN